MPPTWRLLKFPVEGRPVLYFDGSEELKPAQDFQPSGVFEIAHWADTDMARAWFVRARDLLDDEGRRAALDAPPNFTDLARNQEQAQAQIAYLVEIATAMAKGYDALNVFAMADPLNRFAYQRWVSGPAFGEDYSEQLNYWFSKVLNFGAGSSSTRLYGRWFYPNEVYPIFGDSMAKPPAGIIPAMARGVFKERYPRRDTASTHPNQFAGSIGFVLEPDPSQEHNPRTPVQYARFARNKVWTDFRRTITANRAPGVTYGTGFMPDGTRLPGHSAFDRDAGFWDWRAVFFDEASATAWGGESDTRVKLGLIGPARAYLDYLSQVVDACLTRTPQQIIEDTRKFVLWCNAQQVSRNSGVESTFLSQAAGVQGNIEQQLAAPDPGLQAAAAVAQSIGSALGPVTLGIGALVGGSVSAIIKVVDLLTPAMIRGIGRDDLGRYKPLVERGWLSGDIGSEFGGKPIVSDLEYPPGYLDPIQLSRRLHSITFNKILQRMRSGGRLDAFDWESFPFDMTPPTQPVVEEEPSSMVPWALGGAAVLGGLLLWSRTKKKKV